MTTLQNNVLQYYNRKAVVILRYATTLHEVSLTVEGCFHPGVLTVTWPNAKGDLR